MSKMIVIGSGGGTTASGDGTPAAFNINAQRMFPSDPLVYQNIFDALGNGTLRKLGSPTWDETTYRTSPWNGRPILRMGGNTGEADGNGVEITVPEGYDTLWLRILGERWSRFAVAHQDGEQESVGQFCGGHRNLNLYAPDGGMADEHGKHQWLPIPVGRSGVVAMVSKGTNDGGWLSGVAFSKNPWGHATQSAVGYRWAVNGGEVTGWHSHNWNNDQLAVLGAGTRYLLKVPVVPTGRDKLVFLLEHGAAWTGTMHKGVTVGGETVERLSAGWDNPFARHHRASVHQRYIAARVPAALVPDDARFLDVRIDVTNHGDTLYFREIGSHDLMPPTS